MRNDRILGTEEILNIANLLFAEFGSKSAVLQTRCVQALINLFENFPLLILILFPMVAAGH